MKDSVSRSLLVGVRTPLGEECARAVLAGLAARRAPRANEPAAREIAGTMP
jgi:hypothetical protein